MNCPKCGSETRGVISMQSVGVECRSCSWRLSLDDIIRERDRFMSELRRIERERSEKEKP